MKTAVTQSIVQSRLQVIEASYTDPNATNPGVSYATTFSARSVSEPLSVVALTVFGAARFASKRR